MILLLDCQTKINQYFFNSLINKIPTSKFNTSLINFDIDIELSEENIKANLIKLKNIMRNNKSSELIIINFGIISNLTYCLVNNYDYLYSEILQIINDKIFMNINTLCLYNKNETETQFYKDSIHILTQTYHILNDTSSNNNLYMLGYDDEFMDSESIKKTFIFVMSNIFKHLEHK